MISFDEYGENGELLEKSKSDLPSMSYDMQMNYNYDFDHGMMVNKEDNLSAKINTIDAMWREYGANARADKNQLR